MKEKRGVKSPSSVDAKIIQDKSKNGTDGGKKTSESGAEATWDNLSFIYYFYCPQTGQKNFMTNQAQIDSYH